MSDEPKPCPDCGKNHPPNPLFSEETVSLFKKIQESSDPQEKEQLTADLGRAFMEGVQPHDDDIPEEIHLLVEDATEAHLRYTCALLRVGRIIMRNLRVALDGQKTTMEELRHTHMNTEGAHVGEKKRSVH